MRDRTRQRVRGIELEPEKPALPTLGPVNAPILVVCDVPTQAAWKREAPIEGPQMQLFAKTVRTFGFQRDNFRFVAPCPPFPNEVAGSAKRESDFIAEYRDTLLHIIHRHDPKLVVYLGATAGRQLAGRQIKITRVRGQVHQYEAVKCPVLAMLSTGHVLRQRAYLPIFETDAKALRAMADNDYDPNGLELATDHEVDYRWCMDLSFLLAMRPPSIAVDSETTGLRWYDKKVVPLTVQITWEAGKSIVVPVDRRYYPKLSCRAFARVKAQLKELLEDPEIAKAGYNLKYDAHILREGLGIQLKGQLFDTMILAFAADDNMQEKSLDECVRRWVPAMAGYADKFNAETDKGNMRAVPHDQMLQYAGGDTDATFRLAKVLVPEIEADEKQWQVFSRVQMPAINAFQDYVEPQGLGVDTEELLNLQKALDKRSRELYDELIAMVPSAIKRRHVEKGLKFSRADFVRDILFSREGFRLKPRVFTKSTMNLPPKERVASTSAKDHLPYFEDEPFVAMYMEYTRLEKMRGTYVGLPFDPKKEGPSGFWKYIVNGKVHPSYMLHRTVTGRTASADPNGQNFPKRGPLAKAYRKIFKAPPGWVLLEADLSQAELRIAAWMAGERNMLEIYRMGGDIHSATAAEIIGIEYEDFLARAKDTTPLMECLDEFEGAQSWLNQQKREEREVISIAKFLKAMRQQAKAVNFGFLYGMGWRKFMSYAKTDYGVTFTEEQAKAVRSMFFRKYPRLAVWHETMRGFAHEHGYVRALHGALRRLPDIYSDDEGIASGAQRNAINSPVQRFASDLGLIALIRICRDMPKDILKPVAFIHDALIFLVPEERAEELAGNVKWYMETPPLEEWFGIKAPLPITAEPDLGPDLSAMEERPDIPAVRPKWAQPHRDRALA